MSKNTETTNESKQETERTCRKRRDEVIGRHATNDREEKTAQCGSDEQISASHCTAFFGPFARGHTTESSNVD